MLDPLPVGATDTARTAHYAEVLTRIEGLLDGEDDWVAAMATVACELHHAFGYYDWTGFYRARRGADGDVLVLGPYQGGHGCLRIPFDKGVCGAAARTKETQLVPDVEAFAGHIACSSTTRSEIVVPLLTPDGRVLAVLDVDSDTPAAFGDADKAALESLAGKLGARFAGHAPARPGGTAVGHIGSGLEFLQAMVRGEIAQAPIGPTLSFSLVAAERGKVVFEYTPAEHHYNPVGSVHGGVLATLCDSGCGAAVHSTLTPEQFYTSLEIKTSFVRTVTLKSGTLRCTGEVINVGNRVATSEARLVDGHGKLVAHATSTCLILPRQV